MSKNPVQQAGRTVWRRNRWLVVGVAGVAGLAAISALTGVPDFTRSPTSGTSQVDQSSDIGREEGGQADSGQANGGQADSGQANGGRADGGQRNADKQGSQDPGRNNPPRRPASPPGSDGGNSDRDAKTLPCDSDRLITALVQANAGDGGTIELAQNCTYILTANQPFNAGAPTGTGNGLPLITQPVTLKGEDTSIVRAANADPFRIFEVGIGGDLTLKGLTVNGGQPSTEDSRGGGGILVDAGGALTVEDSSITHNAALFSDGGGVANNGTTTIRHSTVSYNSTPDGDGAGISNRGLLKAEESELSFNNAGSEGGGLASLAGSVLLEKTTISNNTARTRGGGIVAANGTTNQVHHSTITENTSSDESGGINNAGAFTLEHSTVSRNTARTLGGGIINNGQFVIEDGAVTDNTTQFSGGGIANETGALVLRRTEVSRNNAVGPNSTGGGIFNIGGTVRLTGSTVIDNSSTNALGGILSTSPVTVDDESVIVRNRPTNCTPGLVTNCFG
jgi:hypothetical protein